MDAATGAKVGAMALLGLGPLVAGLLPIRLAPRQADHRPLPLALLLSFGGGVLLFTAIMHLQPETTAEMEGLVREGLLPLTEVPLGQLLFCAGFFLVYLVEETVEALLGGRSRAEDEVALHRTLSLRRAPVIPRVALGPKPAPPPPPPPQPAPSLRGLFTVLALSFHAVFEGLAVGLQRSAPEVWYLCGAIASHKLVIAVCLGAELVASGTRPGLMLLYLSVFAAVTPAGVLSGLLLSTAAASPPLRIAAVVLQGLAAGTLLYVVFFEVLPKEKCRQHCGLYHLAAVLAGFMTMFALLILLGHSHGGEEHTHVHHYHVHDHDHDHIHDHHDHEHYHTEDHAQLAAS